MGLTRTLGDKPGPGSGRIACPLPLRPFKVRGVFPDRVASKSLDDDASPAGLGPPPEYRAAMAPPQNRSSTGTLLGFRSLRHIQESRLHTGFGSPGSSRLGVSHPREDVLPANPSGLISCRSAHGIHPSGLWSPGTVQRLFPDAMLSRRYGNPSLPSLLRRRRKPGESLDHRALLTTRVRTRPTTRRSFSGPMPSWVQASLGCSPPATSGTEVPNSHALRLPRLS
jgi:hypothetical protein